MPFYQQLNFSYPITIEQLCEDLQNRRFFSPKQWSDFLNYVTTSSNSPLKDAETLSMAYDKAEGKDVTDTLLSVISQSPQTYLTDDIAKKIRVNSDRSKEQKFIAYALTKPGVFCKDSSQLQGLLSIADEDQQKMLFEKALKQLNFTVKRVDHLQQLVKQANTLFTDEKDQRQYQQVLLNAVCRQGLAKGLSQCNLQQLQSNFNHFQYLFNEDIGEQAYDNLFDFAKEQCRHNFHVKQLLETFAESEKQQDLINLAINKGVNSWLDVRIILDACTDQQAKNNFYDQCVLPQFSNLIISYKQLGEIITQAPNEQTERQLIDQGFENNLIYEPEQLRLVYRSLNANQNTEILSENQAYLMQKATIEAPTQYMPTIRDAIKCAKLINSEPYKEMIMNNIITHRLYDEINENNLQAFKDNFIDTSLGVNDVEALDDNDGVNNIKTKLTAVRRARFTRLYRSAVQQQSAQPQDPNSSLYNEETRDQVEPVEPGEEPGEERHESRGHVEENVGGNQNPSQEDSEEEDHTNDSTLRM